MNYDPELAALLSQPWSNDACRGYVIAAMERCGFKPSDIKQVMVELYEVFDYTTLQEAEAYYERSPYYVLDTLSRGTYPAKGQHFPGAGLCHVSRHSLIVWEGFYAGTGQI